MRVCLATRDEELTCDELLDLLAVFLEAPEAASSGDRRLTLAQEHLRVCGNCREESEALATFLREDSGRRQTP
jgi:hypothetical protein